MNNLMNALGCFVIVYLFYLFFIILRKKSLLRYKKSREYMYLKSRYKFDQDKVDIKYVATWCGIINAFIIGLTIFIIGYIDNFVLKILIGFLILFPLILTLYHVLGKNLEKKYMKR